MQWSLHSSDPCTTADLPAHLEKARADYDMGLKRKFAWNLLNNDVPTERQPIDEAVTAQQVKCIASAIGVARDLAGTNTALKFHVSLSGHVEAEHPEGITQRIAVFVDVAPEPRTAAAAPVQETTTVSPPIV